MGKNGLCNRVGRHIRSNKPSKWHVDYLKLPVREVWVSGFGSRLECEWASTLKAVISVNVIGFGCTDCKCQSHLFYFKSNAILKKSKQEFCKRQHLKSVKAQIAFNLGAETVPLPKVFQLMSR
jgi:Uri superfamily endonuclease